MEHIGHVPTWTLLTICMANNAVPFHSLPLSITSEIEVPALPTLYFTMGIDGDTVKSKELKGNTSCDCFCHLACVTVVT